MQGLGGSAPGLNRGATMSGNKASVGFTDPNPIKCSRGLGVASPYAIPNTGLYLFCWQGAGGAGNDGADGHGGTGSLALARVRLNQGNVVTFTANSVTFPGGRVMTAQSGNGAAGDDPGANGVATGGDININGGVGYDIFPAEGWAGFGLGGLGGPGNQTIVYCGV